MDSAIPTMLLLLLALGVDFCHKHGSACAGKGRGFEVVRYHSLAVREETLPLSLEPLAWTCGAHHAVDLHGSVQVMPAPVVMHRVSLGWVKQWKVPFLRQYLGPFPGHLVWSRAHPAVGTVKRLRDMLESDPGNPVLWLPF